MERLLILVVGLASIVAGLTGPMRLAASPRNERDREAHTKLIGFGALSIGGGLLLAGYALFA